MSCGELDEQPRTGLSLRGETQYTTLNVDLTSG